MSCSFLTPAPHPAAEGDEAEPRQRRIERRAIFMRLLRFAPSGGSVDRPVQSPHLPFDIVADKRHGARPARDFGASTAETRCGRQPGLYGQPLAASIAVGSGLAAAWVERAALKRRLQAIEADDIRAMLTINSLELREGGGMFYMPGESKERCLNTDELRRLEWRPVLERCASHSQFISPTALGRITPSRSQKKTLTGPLQTSVLRHSDTTTVAHTCPRPRHLLIQLQLDHYQKTIIKKRLSSSSSGLAVFASPGRGAPSPCPL